MQYQRQYTITKDDAKTFNIAINKINYDTTHLIIDGLGVPEDAKIDNLPVMLQSIYIKYVHVIRKNNKTQLIVSKEDVEKFIEKYFTKIPFGCVITYDNEMFIED